MVKNTVVKARRDAELLVGVGSQGTAALGIMMNLLLALREKGALRNIEVVTILDSAAETAENSKGTLGQKLGKIVAAHIREMIHPFTNPAKLGSRH